MAYIALSHSNSVAGNIMGHLEQEELHSVSLDSRSRIISEGMIYKGTSVNSVNIRVGEIFRRAIRDNAASIIIAHNHPSGDSSPSLEDLSVTQEVVKAGKLLQVETLDHLIITGTIYTGLKARLGVWVNPLVRS